MGRAESAPVGAGGDCAGSVVSHEEPPWWSGSRRAEIQSANFSNAGTPIMGGDDEGPQGGTSDAVCLCLLVEARQGQVAQRRTAAMLTGEDMVDRERTVG